MFVVQKNWSYLKRNEFSLGMLRRRYRISLNVLKIDGYYSLKIRVTLLILLRLPRRRNFFFFRKKLKFQTRSETFEASSGLGAKLIGRDKEIRLRIDRCSID